MMQEHRSNKKCSHSLSLVPIKAKSRFATKTRFCNSKKWMDIFIADAMDNARYMGAVACDYIDVLSYQIGVPS